MKERVRNWLNALGAWQSWCNPRHYGLNKSLISLRSENSSFFHLYVLLGLRRRKLHCFFLLVLGSHELAFFEVSLIARASIIIFALRWLSLLGPAWCVCLFTASLGCNLVSRTWEIVVEFTASIWSLARRSQALLNFIHFLLLLTPALFKIPS